MNANDMPAEATATLLRLYRSEETIVLPLQPFAAWTLVACLQLAWRHPHLSPGQKRVLEDVARQIQALVTALEPAAEPWLAQGWQTEFDVVREASK